MKKEHAVMILNNCGITGRENFHTLSSDVVSKLVDWAVTCKYSAPKFANGSRARYFFAMLVRNAKPETVAELNEQWLNDPNRKDKHWLDKDIADQATRRGKTVEADAKFMRGVAEYQEHIEKPKAKFMEY